MISLVCYYGPTPSPPRSLHCLHFADVEKKTVQNHSVLAEQIFISCADVITINVSPGQRQLRPLTWKRNSDHVFESFTGTFFLSCMFNLLPPPLTSTIPSEREIANLPQGKDSEPSVKRVSAMSGLRVLIGLMGSVIQSSVTRWYSQSAIRTLPFWLWCQELSIITC